MSRQFRIEAVLVLDCHSDWDSAKVAQYVRTQLLSGKEEIASLRVEEGSLKKTAELEAQDLRVRHLRVGRFPTTEDDTAIEGKVSR